jgi:hypothetical protein
MSMYLGSPLKMSAQKGGDKYASTGLYNQLEKSMRDIDTIIDIQK